MRRPTCAHAGRAPRAIVLTGAGGSPSRKPSRSPKTSRSSCRRSATSSHPTCRSITTPATACCSARRSASDWCVRLELGWAARRCIGRRLMPGFARFLFRDAMVAGLLLMAGTSASLAQERVGVNSAVNPEATGAVPGAAPRRLVIGQDVIFNEHITTAASGQTQLLFLDESSMSIGPNSDLTIDQFVYDPKTGTGKLAMSATRGLLRYVGGKLSKQNEAVTLRAATATLAVRGGAFIVQIQPGDQLNATFLYGKALTVTGAAGVSQTLTRPGFMITVSGPGAAPSPPVPAPPGLLALFTQQLDGQPGGSGGASVIPTDTTVAGSGISQTISGNVAQSVQQAAQNQGTTPTLQPNPTNPTPVPPTVTSTVQSTA